MSIRLKQAGTLTPAELLELVETLTRDKENLQAALEEANIDPLTGAGTRRACDDFVASLSKADRRTYDPNIRCVLILDCDHFGAINKKYGQDQGDKVLAEFLKKFRGTAHLRTHDKVFRYGGDEILVFFFGATADDMLKYIKCFQYNVAVEPPEKDAPLLTVTVNTSGAFTDFPLNEDFHKATYPRLSDGLRGAKNLGRNRIVKIDEEGRITEPPSQP